MTQVNPNNKINQKIRRQNILSARQKNRQPVSKPISPTNGASIEELLLCQHNLDLDGKHFKPGG